MFFLDLLFVFFITILFVAIFNGVSRQQNSRDSLAVFFIILLMATWMGGLWITPLGAPIFGVYWLSFFVVGLFIMMLLSAIISISDRNHRRYYKEGKYTDTALVIDVFLWAFIIITLGSIIFSYVF